MKTSKSWIAVPVVVAAILFATYKMWPDEPAARSGAQPEPTASSRTPVRPTTPPVPGKDRPPRNPMPEAPPVDIAVLSKIYDDAKAAGDPQPGEKAFRANVAAFMKYNRAFAEDQAKAEGISIDEVAELTYFGLLVQRTQMWGDVEELLGYPLSAEQRSAGEALMHDTNKEFKSAMRELVAESADIDERWALIRATKERYRSQYYATTGMTPSLVDDLLAGDLSRNYAPSVTPVPEDIPENPDYSTPEPRPETDPGEAMN